ncbi:MAG TPA: head maturation protease, ClpP-related [Bellilinea sp.]|nr:head maturation protease, ClpP-related [Bellilinea sp.]
MNKRKPMRVFEGSAQPYEAFWRLTDATESESGEAEIEFYGYISEYSWWDDDVTPAKFKADLINIGKGGPVTVRINSGGGEVYAASVIRAMLMDYPGKVTARIDGLCASAATLVAMAGDVVKMQDSGYFMIHDPSVLTWGNEEELQEAIDFLAKIKEGLVDAYVNKTKMEPEKLAQMMKDTTWMTAKQAHEMGFVDEVITVGAKDFMQGTAAGVMNCLRDYANVPPELLASEMEPAIAEEEKTPDPSDAGEVVEPSRKGFDEREVKSLRNYVNVFRKGAK